MDSIGQRCFMDDPFRSNMGSDTQADNTFHT